MTIVPDAVERVAEALARHNAAAAALGIEWAEEKREWWRGMARAALAALFSNGKTEGNRRTVATVLEEW